MEAVSGKPAGLNKKLALVDGLIDSTARKDMLTPGTAGLEIVAAKLAVLSLNLPYSLSRMHGRDLHPRTHYSRCPYVASSRHSKASEIAQPLSIEHIA